MLHASLETRQKINQAFGHLGSSKVASVLHSKGIRPFDEVTLLDVPKNHRYLVINVDGKPVRINMHTKKAFIRHNFYWAALKGYSPIRYRFVLRDKY